MTATTMEASLTTQEGRRPSSLPPISTDHGFREGERVSMPLYGAKTVQGTLTRIDITRGKKRFLGLVLLCDVDRCYYEFYPEIATRL
jgi:hypothetical protein